MDPENNDTQIDPAASPATAGVPAAAPAGAAADDTADKGSLLDAIRAGVSEANGKPIEKPSEPPADEPAPAGDAAVATGERPRGPDGKFLPKDAAGQTIPAATATAATPGAPDTQGKPAGQQPDPLNDPVNTGNARTDERIKTLITLAKDNGSRADGAQQQLDELVGMVSQTGATPEQFNESLQYLTMVNSRDPRTIESQAIPLLERELDALYTMIGKPRPAFDPLAQHQDLTAAVQAGQITAQLAQEIASRRRQDTLTQDRQQQTLQQQQAEQQAVVAARDAGNQLEATLRAVDPLYEQKKAVVLQTLNLAALPAAQRAKAFADAYAKVQLPAAAPAAAAAPATAAAPASPQPLRARQPAGGAVKQPGSMLEAIRAGVSAAGQR